MSKFGLPTLLMLCTVVVFSGIIFLVGEKELIALLSSICHFVVVSPIRVFL